MAETSGETDRRAEVLALLPPSTIAEIAAHLLTRALDGCHYCGVKPGQDTPRPSYFEMRTLLADVAAANADGEGGHEDVWEAVDAMVAYFPGDSR